MTRLLAVVLAMLAVGCAADPPVDPGAGTLVGMADPGPAGGGPLQLPSANRAGLDVPLRVPDGIDGVTFGLRPEEPCTLTANVTNDTLRFPFDSAVIDQAGADALERLVRGVVATNDRTLLAVVAVGHASQDGPPTPSRQAHDQRLSERRAAAVAGVVESALGRLGITVSVDDDGKGTDAPVAGNETEEGRRANRRVEIRFDYNGCEPGVGQ